MPDETREATRYCRPCETGEGQHTCGLGTARYGYDRAVAVLLGVHERTGSPAAKWAADYLTADPDRLAPAPPEDTRTEAVGDFEAWLVAELRGAGCEIRTLSPEGMARITVQRLIRDGWSVIPSPRAGVPVLSTATDPPAVSHNRETSDTAGPPCPDELHGADGGNCPTCGTDPYAAAGVPAPAFGAAFGGGDTTDGLVYRAAGVIADAARVPDGSPWRSAVALWAAGMLTEPAGAPPGDASVVADGAYGMGVADGRRLAAEALGVAEGSPVWRLMVGGPGPGEKLAAPHVPEALPVVPPCADLTDAAWGEAGDVR